MVNTTKSVHGEPRGTREEVTPNASPAHTINTSAVVEENLEYIDEPEEPEILAVLPGGDYHAVLEQEDVQRTVPLVAWVAEDSGRMYGVALGEDGRVELLEGDVEKLDGFVRYEKTNNEKE